MVRFNFPNSFGMSVNDIVIFTDLEKRQHAFASGELLPEVHAPRATIDHTRDFVGGFPKKDL